MSLAVRMPLVKVLDYDWGGIQGSSDYKYDTRTHPKNLTAEAWERTGGQPQIANALCETFIVGEADPCAREFLLVSNSEGT
jgi:hypothetical protein